MNNTNQKSYAVVLMAIGLAVATGLIADVHLSYPSDYTEAAYGSGAVPGRYEAKNNTGHVVEARGHYAWFPSGKDVETGYKLDPDLKDGDQDNFYVFVAAHPYGGSPQALTGHNGSGKLLWDDIYPEPSE